MRLGKSVLVTLILASICMVCGDADAPAMSVRMQLEDIPVSRASPVIAPFGTLLIPGGTFWIGCVPGDDRCEADERPRHQVTLSPYYIDDFEVIVGEYRDCVQAGRCRKINFTEWGENAQTCNYGRMERINHPMNCVNWYGAKEYCEWVGKRLPTEAEWEHAARGGLEGRKYPWGDQAADCHRAVMLQEPKSGETGCGRLGTWPVGSFAANGYGLYDMAGNAWEWCSDVYDGSSYSSDMSGSASDSSRVMRGGSWNVEAWNLRISNRLSALPSDKGDYMGFRCVRDP